MMKTSRSGHYYKSKNKKGDAFLLEKIREVACRVSLLWIQEGNGPA